MSKHTPGPWTVEKTKSSIWISPKDDEDFTVVSIPIEYMKSKELKRAEADAVLIAEAPEMLRSLEGCLAIIRSDYLGILDAYCLIVDGEPDRSTLEEDIREDVEEYERVLADIEAIIARAKGR